MKQQLNRVKLTAGRVDAFICPPDKAQAFLWDTDTPTLALRATPTGRKTYVFESRLNGATIRINIGTLADWPIKQARTKAQGQKMLVDAGTDPREVERDRQAAAVEKKTAAAAHSVTVGEVWAVYVEERRPQWGDLHYRDHFRKTAPGGESFKRGTGTTQPGPLFPLMALPLRDLTAPVIETWAAREALTRATSARLAWRMLKVFLGWCEEQPAYAGLLPAKNPAKTKKSREALGKAGTKSDALQREQLTVWFESVRNIGNPLIAAYLQTLLLTGARPGEVLAMRWEDMNTKWKGLTIRDKVEGVRVIPLTPFVAQLLATLPRRNDWVFSSPNSDTGHLTEPNHPHSLACKVAGIDGLTLHGLRRSFKSLTEWLEVPAGVVAQLMGHKPSATAEKHYTVRPLDLLRVHHEKIEAWILEQAGIVFDANVEPVKFRVVVWIGVRMTNPRFLFSISLVGLFACSSPEAGHRDIVKLHLNDPDSAVFRNAFKSKRDNVWCGEVNAKNRMGGMVGFSKYVLFMPDVNAQGVDALRNSSSIIFESYDTFESRWNIFCTGRT